VDVRKSLNRLRRFFANLANGKTAGIVRDAGALFRPGFGERELFTAL
jgi:hypothetical protein